MKIVIAGGGPAAFESAVAARKAADDAEIAIYSAESVLPYRRPALSSLLGAGKTIEEKTFFIKPQSFYDEKNIRFYPGSPAAAVEGKTLVLESGEKVGFDRLIIACGSRAVQLPIPGADLPHVFTLRSVADMEKLRKRLESGVSQAVIIGGGVLGLEIAESLLSRNIKTVVLEAAATLFAGKLPADEAAALLERLNKIDNLHISCGECVKEITDDKVIMRSGESVCAEIVIAAAGSRPDLTLAESAGVVCGKGIVVDEFMCSSREDIYAAGDAAEFNGRCFNLYMDAVASGKIAGANAAGERNKFTAGVSPVRLFALGEKLVLQAN